ncbi:hypothetical protein CWO91_16710 [Bradyrhizobium genosp. SA-3]|uniref:hypothetical protein n=1 Tax=Bradyrhizobium genosp. SA-3 TaxID=508868 RepID=UPI001029E0B7|nr:hypothetical protein [Bradyrhizobium genosp. SA-3]RZN09669.1 hypothetical protein CWO91_16710 [Bradyrhizobium genosp. SA-3]
MTREELAKRHREYQSEYGEGLVTHIDKIERHQAPSAVDILVTQALLSGARFEKTEDSEVQYRLFIGEYDAGGWMNRTRAALAANLILGVPLPEKVTP